MKPFPVINNYIRGLRAWDIKEYNDSTIDTLTIVLVHKKLKCEKYFCIHKYSDNKYLLTFNQEHVWSNRYQEFREIESQQFYTQESDVKQRMKYLLRLQTYPNK